MYMYTVTKKKEVENVLKGIYLLQMLSYYNHVDGTIKQTSNNPQSPTTITLLGSEIRQILRSTPYEVTRKFNNGINNNNVYSKSVRTKYDSYYYYHTACCDHFNIQIKWITFRNEIMEELLKLNGSVYFEENISITDPQKNFINVDDIQKVHSTNSLFYNPLRILCNSPQITSSTSGLNKPYANKKLNSLKKSKFRDNVKNMIKTLRIKVKDVFAFKSKSQYKNSVNDKNSTSISTITISNVDLLPIEQSSPVRFCVSSSFDGSSNNNEIIYSGSEDNTIDPPWRFNPSC